MEIIDAHTHIGDVCSPHADGVNVPYVEGLPSNLLEQLDYPSILSLLVSSSIYPRNLLLKFCRRAADFASSDNLVASMNDSAISKSLVLPIAPAISTLEVLNQCSTYKQLVPLISVDFNLSHVDVDTQLRDSLSCYPYRGVKFHPNLQGIRPFSDIAFSLYEAAAKRGLFIIMHVGRTPFLSGDLHKYAISSAVYEIPKRFPKTRFILSHMASYFEFNSKILKNYERLSNVWLDTSGVGSKTIQLGLNAVGEDRVVFGSDWPYASQKGSWNLLLKAVRGYCKSAHKNFDDVLTKIASGNITQLLSFDNHHAKVA